MPSPEGPEIPFDIILKSEVAAEEAERAEWNFRIPPIEEVEKRVEDPARAEVIAHHMEVEYEWQSAQQSQPGKDGKRRASKEYVLDYNADLMAARLDENPYQPWLMQVRQEGKLPNYYRWLRQEKERERFTLSTIQQQRPDMLDVWSKFPKLYYLQWREAVLGKSGPTPEQVVAKEIIDALGQRTYEEAHEHYDRLRGVEVAEHGAAQLLMAESFVQEAVTSGAVESKRAEWEAAYQAADTYLQTPESWTVKALDKREAALREREASKVKLALLSSTESQS